MANNHNGHLMSSLNGGAFAGGNQIKVCVYGVEGVVGPRWVPYLWFVSLQHHPSSFVKTISISLWEAPLLHFPFLQFWWPLSYLPRSQDGHVTQAWPIRAMIPSSSLPTWELSLTNVRWPKSGKCNSILGLSLTLLKKISPLSLTWC